MIERSSWGMQIAPRRRLALAVSHPIDVDGVAESLVLGRLASRAADALTLSHGGAPRLVGGVTEISDDGSTWRAIAVQVGSGQWPGSALEKLASSVQPLDIETVWRSDTSDPRLGLGLPLYRGMAAEDRWDTRILRSIALLEAIASEAFPSSVAVMDRTGGKLLGHGGKPARTRETRGRIFMLLQHCLTAVGIDDAALLTHSDHTLWHEVGVWVDMRHAVAHQGQWLPPPIPVSSPTSQARVAAAFETAGRGDGMDGRTRRYSDACAAATEVVLRTAAQTQIGPVTGPPPS